ncbi:hypothetical protein Bphy_2406 [Paraburkholderia phymatum STM815]|uniref:Uncharacterized protein n=1 Tax=Paraburkholderia phymatum (strain DSM 17167 / CIP 108236 / LMG 21445 / STM815) TaxID=391038 RepID=B2JFV6_PARP8|nr:hypothetical protein Bphy_2406 [Paraburkholderia phymatum STM815]
MLRFVVGEANSGSRTGRRQFQSYVAICRRLRVVRRTFANEASWIPPPHPSGMNVLFPTSNETSYRCPSADSVGIVCTSAAR